MNASRRFSGRLFVSLMIAGVLLTIGAAAAAGQTASGSAPTIGRAVSTSMGIAAPAWCCETTGGVPGLTAMGQATMNGQGATSRDAAIAKAVQDATEQARAAADAADIQLGAIIDLQISSMPIAYPMMGGVGGTSGAGTATGSAPGSPNGDPMQPVPYLGSVSVTITWSLG